MFRKKILSVALASIMLMQAGCGTILYPERRGQTNGNFDPNVLILNGIGLLFFVIPGVIAFAVDLTNGTIYLPEGGNDTQQTTDAIDIEGKVTADAINVIIENERNIRNVLDHPELQVSETRL